jgi:hypothetical protein
MSERGGVAYKTTRVVVTQCLGVSESLQKWVRSQNHVFDILYFLRFTTHAGDIFIWSAILARLRRGGVKWKKKGKINEKVKIQCIMSLAASVFPAPDSPLCVRKKILSPIQLK